MHAPSSSSRARYLFLTVLAVLAGWAVVARATDPERMNKADEPPPPPAKKAEPPVKPPEKKAPEKPTDKFMQRNYVLEMRSKPWGQVLEWLSDTTGMPVVATNKLSDTFSYISPQGMKYNIPEIIDIFNESLVTYVNDVSIAIARAKEAAGDKNVLVHGAAVAQLALAAGILDELEIHLVPVLLGQGRRLFDNLDPEQIELERTRILEGEGGVTHMHYRVQR